MKNLIATLILASSLAFTVNSFAGSAQAILKCQSQSGKTKVLAIFPGDSAESGIIFKIEDKEIAYMDQNLKELRELNDNRIFQEYAHAHLAEFKIINQLKNQKLEITVSKNRQVLKFEAISGSVSIKKTQNGSRGKLNAKVQGVDPRTGEESKIIEVRCEYIYEI